MAYTFGVVHVDRDVASSVDSVKRNGENINHGLAKRSTNTVLGFAEKLSEYFSEPKVSE